MSNVYVHFSLISFSAQYSVVNFQWEPLSVRFREVIILLLQSKNPATLIGLAAPLDAVLHHYLDNLQDIHSLSLHHLL